MQLACLILNIFQVKAIIPQEVLFFMALRNIFCNNVFHAILNETRYRYKINNVDF